MVYQVMEFMDCSLAEYCQKKYLNNAEMSPPTIKHILREITYGLEYLHDKNIIHRDMKPGTINFLLRLTERPRKYYDVV